MTARVCVCGDTLTMIGAGATAILMAADAVLAASTMEMAVRMMEADAANCAGAVYVMALPEALEVAESVPHAPGLH